MTQKRKTYPSGPQTAQFKRARFANGDHEADAESSSRAQVDPTYGQRSAFPGIDDTAGDDGLFYGPASDGLEYLRMVRSEAKGVPNLLTATKSRTSDEEDNLYHDYPQGYYEDGAYVAASIPSNARKVRRGADEDIDPQEAYYSSLLDRLRTLKSTLRSSAPASAPSPPTVTTANILRDAPAKRWRTTLLYTRPTTALLIQLSQESIINGIAALEKHLDWKMLERGEYVGAWAWGLLATCRSVGMMGSEEVGVLRNLGKKARGLVRGLAAGLGSRAEDEESNEVEEGEGVEAIQDQDQTRPEHNGLENDLFDGMNAMPNLPPDFNVNDMEKAKERLLATLQRNVQSSPSDPLSRTGEHAAKTRQDNSQPAQDEAAALLLSLPPEGSQPGGILPDGTADEDQILLTTRIAATLDMLITVVGEEYGQRDLLDGRMVWD